MGKSRDFVIQIAWCDSGQKYKLWRQWRMTINIIYTVCNFPMYKQNLKYRSETHSSGANAHLCDISIYGEVNTWYGQKATSKSAYFDDRELQHQ